LKATYIGGCSNRVDRLSDGRGEGSNALMMSLLLIFALAAVAIPGPAHISAYTPTRIEDEGDSHRFERGGHDVFIDAANEVATVLRWPLLSETIPHAEQEIRIWVGFGLTYPMSVIRLQRRGIHWSGQLVRWWPKDLPEPANAEAQSFIKDLERGCAAIRRSSKLTACAVGLPSDLASQSAQRMTDFGLWKLQDPVMPARGAFTLMVDGTSTLIELHEDHRYRALHFSVSSDTAWDYDDAAAKIANMVEEMEQSSRSALDVKW
jgi:hypothetical protein